MSRDDERSAPQPQPPPDSVTERPDAQPSPVYERFTRLASRLADAPIAVLGVSQGDQFQVLATLGASELLQPHSNLPSSRCLCQHIIDQQQPLVIPDTVTSAIAQNCWIVARTGTRSFLGVPIGVSGGQTVGCLMVADVAPREWSDRDITSLEDLAILLANEIERHHLQDSVAEVASRMQQSQTGRERLLEAIGEGVYAVDTSGYCQFINRAGANMLGYAPEQMIGKRMHELVHHSYPDGRPMPRSECTVVQAMLAGDAMTLSEHVFWRRDGSPVFVELTVSPVTDREQVTGTVVRFSDVSERQRQQELLRESEVRKSAMFEAALDCIITIDHVGRVLEFNAAAERTLGYSREYAIGRMMADLIMPEAFHQQCLDAFQEHLKTGESSILGARIERPAMRADGTIIETEMAITRIDLPDQPNPIFTAYLRDITHRNSAEREIRRYKHMVDAVGQAVIANDNSPERLITYWNKAAEQILGWPAEDVIGKGFYDIVPAPDFQPDVEAIGVDVRQGHNWRGEFQMRHRDGHVIPALASVSAILNEAGELLGVISAYTDLTEIKQTEEELRYHKHAIDAIGQTVIANRLDRKINYWNRAAEETLGWSADEVIGKSFYDVVPDESVIPQIDELAATVRSGGSWQGELLFRRKDGKTIPTMSSVRGVLGSDGEMIGVIGAHVDLTEMKEANREIRLYKHLTDAVGQALVGNDLDRRITYWNRAAEEMLGWSAEEVIGRQFSEIVPSGEWLDSVRDIGELVREGASWSGEFMLKRKSGETFPVLISVSPVLDDDGNVIQIIGAYTDISELKETEREIRLYKHLTDAVGQALVGNDLHRRITYWNQAAEEMLGWTAEEVIGRDFYEVAPADDWLDRISDVGQRIRQERSWSGEFRLKRKSGETFPVLMSVSPVLDDDGNVLQIIGAYTDISELKETEREIRFHKQLSDATGQALVSNDLNRHITYWNNAAELMFGWQEHEVRGRDFAEIAVHDDYQARVPPISAQVREGVPWSGEFLLKHRDGRTIPALMSINPVFDEDGNIVQIIGAYTDISDLKATEEDLLFHKQVVGTVEQPIIGNDTDGRVTYFNKAAEDLLGWKAEEVLDRVWTEFGPARDLGDDIPSIGQYVRDGQPWTGESGLQRRDGSYIPVIKHISPVLDEDGNVTQIIGAYTDVTRLRQREEDIRFFKHIVEAIGEAVVSTDMGGVIRYMNNAAEDILGWSADELIGLPLLDVLPNPDFLARARKIAAYVRTGKTFSGEFELLRKDGTIFPALISLAPVTNESGEQTGVISVYNDITDLKQALDENRFFKHIVDAVGQAVVVSHTDGRITYWNKSAEAIYGWTSEEVLGKPVFDLLPVESDRERALDVTSNVASGNAWSGETRVHHRDGTEFPAYFTVAPIRNAEDEIVGIIGVSHDISDQKEYERQIEFHKIMLDAVGQTIVTTDTNRNITFWSKGAENALGWTADEVLGRPISEFAPAAHLKEEAGELHRKVKSGETWTGEFPIRRKDGSQFPAVVTLAPVKLAEQGTVGVIGVYTDITEFKETEDELRFHKHMLDAVGQAVCATDESLTITYWNQSAEDLYGFTAAEAIGMKLLDFLPPGSTGLSQAVNAIEIVSREGDWVGEMFTYHKDGREIAALVSISPILGAEERQVGLIVAMADISARRAIEQALQESNDQITEILESMGDGFVSVTRDWTIAYVNREVETISSTSREDLLGKNFWEMFPDPPHQPFYRKFVEAFETGQGVHISDYDEHLGMWLEVYATPSRDQLSVFVHDVTERREREIALREAEERYRTLIEQLPAMTYISRADDVSDITYLSPQVETMFGYTQEQWTSEEGFWLKILHPEDRERVIQEDHRTNELNRDRFVLEYRLCAADGRYRWVRDSATLIRDIDGQPVYWQGLSYDITEEKRSERIVRESEQRFRSLFDNHPDAVFSIDSTGHVLSANPKFEELSGVSSREPGVVTFVDLVVPEDQRRVARLFAETHQGMPRDFRAGMVDPYGKRLELSLTTIPISVDDEIVGVHVVAQDITVHQELENQLAHQAYHDALTGLPNRNLFQNRLDERLDQSRQDQSRFAVLFFDLDDFKVINDSLGHSAGDQLLVEVAGRVQTCIRTHDLLARLGGDEFTILLEHIDDENDAVLIAERVAAVLDEPFDIEGHEVFATTSLGIAFGDCLSPGSDDILRNADLAMYEAKNSGKNRYAIFEPSMNSRAWLRLTLETEIRRGIPRDEFVVYYQPIIDLETGELDGVEALVRWNHPERGFLTPGDFISVAEQSGLILPLGRWIIRESTAQLRDWQHLMPAGRNLRLSLNLSPKQYQHPRLIEELTRTLATVEFDPTLITMEITESIAMDDSPETIQTLQELKDVGVQLALDDFGTGFSALSYLRRFPIDIIKIDQSFVAGLGLDEEDTSIVRAVMAASLAMKLSVTAEGIETHEQLNMLRELGCQYGQGYLFARALTADEMHRIIEKGDLSWDSLISPRS